MGLHAKYFVTGSLDLVNEILLNRSSISVFWNFGFVKWYIVNIWRCSLILFLLFLGIFLSREDKIMFIKQLEFVVKGKKGLNSAFVSRINVKITRSRNTLTICILVIRLQNLSLDTNDFTQAFLTWSASSFDTQTYF